MVTARAEPIGEAQFKALCEASLDILVDEQHRGSGMLVDARGRAITAAHMLQDPGRRIEVVSPVAGRVAARLVAVDLAHDLALLQLPEREGGYPTLTPTETWPPVGSELYLFGSPLFRVSMLQRGMVSHPRAGYEYYGNLHRYAEVRYVAAPIQHGTSGGPWLNEQGQLVGMQSGSMQIGGTPCGIAFVVPAAAIIQLLESGASSETATLGAAVEELWQHDAKVRRRFPPHTEGLVLRNPKPDGPAARAGLKEWDLVQSVDGQPVTRINAFVARIRQAKPGQNIRLGILAPDGMGRRDVQVTMGKLEAGWP
jgi:serine protease Do